MTNLSEGQGLIESISQTSWGTSIAVHYLMKDIESALDSLPTSLDKLSTKESLLSINQISPEDFLKLYLPPEAGQTTSLLLHSQTRHEENLAFRLIKLVVFLCSNNLALRSPKRENELSQYVEDLFLSVSGAIDMFCNLVVSHNLHGVLQKIISFKTPATEIFAGQALICAVEMENERLVRTILHHTPPLDAKKYMQSARLKNATALHFAAFQQNASLVQLLLEAGHDPDRHPFCQGLSCTGVKNPLDMIFQSFHKRTSTDSRLIQMLLDAQWAIREPEYTRSYLNVLAQLAINADESEALRLVLERHGRLEPLSPPSADSLLQIKISLWEGNMDLAFALLEESPKFELIFNPHSLHAKLIFHRIRRRKLEFVVYSVLEDPLQSPSDLACEMIMLAIKHGRNNVIMHILAGAPGILATKRYTEVILDSLVVHDSGEVLELFVEAGLEVNDQMDQLLYQAKYENKLEMVKTLLHYGATPATPPSEDFSKPRSLEYALGVSDSYFERALILAPSPIPLKEIPELLSKASICCSLSTFEKLITACAIKNHMKIPDVFAAWGIDASVGVLVILNRYGQEWLQWLNANKTSFDLFSAYLEDYHLLLSKNFGEILYDLDNRGQRLRHSAYDFRASTTAISFDADTAALKELLDFGVTPGLGLLKLCLSSCGRHGLKNAHLILECRASLQSTASCQELTTIFNSVIEHLRAQHGEAYPLSYNKSDNCWRNHLAVLDFLVRQDTNIEAVWQIKAWRNDNNIDYGLAYGTILSGSPWIAAFDSGYAAVEQLVQSGADVNSEFLIRQSQAGPRLRALVRREPKMAELLVSKGADANVLFNGWCFSGSNMTALQMAVEAGYFQLVLALLQAGALVDTRVSTYTALDWAAKRGRLDITCLLTKNYPNLSRLQTDCKQAARLARGEGHSVIANLLDEQANVSANQLHVSNDDYSDAYCICNGSIYTDYKFFELGYTCQPAKAERLFLIEKVASQYDESDLEVEVGSQFSDSDLEEEENSQCDESGLEEKVASQLHELGREEAPGDDQGDLMLYEIPEGRKLRTSEINKEGGSAKEIPF